MAEFDALSAYRELADLTESLEDLATEYQRLGDELSKAEYEYQLELSKALVWAKEKYGVTIGEKMARGIPEVAELRLRRDLAKEARRTTSEIINVQKLRVRVLMAQAGAEAGRPSYM